MFQKIVNYKKKLGLKKSLKHKTFGVQTHLITVGGKFHLSNSEESIVP